MSADLTFLQNFNGIARLFPLPNLVFFPCAIQGLHIFEPRYRQMTADALADDHFIAMALLRPGWETDYAGRPPLYPMACLGRIEANQRLEDGRYNLHLFGLCRVRILQEIDDGKLYRRARVEVVQERPVVVPEIEGDLRRRLTEVIQAWSPVQEPAATVFRKLLNSNLSLARVCDLFSFALPLTVEVKQELLETPDVERRARKLLSHLETPAPSPAAVTPPPQFPPGFSDN